MTTGADRAAGTDDGSRTPDRPGLGASFWKLWTAATVSKVGDGVVMVAIPWLTTDSPAAPSWSP